MDGRLAPYRLIPPSLQLILRRGENLFAFVQEHVEPLKADTCASSAPVASVDPHGSLESNNDICGPDAAAAVTTFFLRNSWMMAVNGDKPRYDERSSIISGK